MRKRVNLGYISTENSYYECRQTHIFDFFSISSDILMFVSGSQIVKLCQNRFNSRTDSKPDVGGRTESSRHMCKHTRNLVGTIEHWRCHLHVMAGNGSLNFLLICLKVTILFAKVRGKVMFSVVCLIVFTRAGVVHIP